MVVIIISIVFLMTLYLIKRLGSDKSTELAQEYIDESLEQDEIKNTYFYLKDYYSKWKNEIMNKKRFDIEQYKEEFQFFKKLYEGWLL